MAAVSTYLNFERETEAAFAFYKSVFDTEYTHEGIMRFGDIPSSDGVQPVAEEDKNLIMHVELPILDGHLLMGSDAPGSMGFRVTKGNSVYIMLQPDTRVETVKLFNALSEGGQIEQPLSDMFWGGFYGSLRDKFGIQWMFNCCEQI